MWQDTERSARTRSAISTPCYVIAEIGHNHQGSLEKARELFREAKLAGAHAVKLQKRDNRGLYTRAAYDKPYDNENSFGADLRRASRVPRVRRERVHASCRPMRKSSAWTSSPRRSTWPAPTSCESLDVPAYKIASGDLKSTPLLKHVASFGKPMIVSTGGAQLEDVQRAYDAIMPINPQLAILQCTAGYPAAFEELDLRVIAHLPRALSRTRSSASRATTTASPCRWPPTCSARGSSRSTSR